MANFQKISPRIMLPAIIATILFSTALYFVAISIVHNMVEDNLNQNAGSKFGDITISEKRIARKMLGQASLFSQAKAVQDAYATAYQGDLNNADDPYLEMARQQLRNYFVSIEKGFLQNNPGGSLRLHFHLPPARSLLRIWKKDQHKSDDLSAFRETVSTISSGTNQPITGIEVGRGGFAIRGIAPVFSPDGQFLGSVESLSSYDPLVTFSVSNDKEYIAVYMNKSLLPIATKLQDQSKNPIIGNHFVFISSTDKAVTDQIVTPDLLTEGQAGMKSKRTNDFFTTVLPIKDFSGKQIGVMAYCYNAGYLYAKVDQIKLRVIILCVILLVAISVPLLISTRSVVAPINRTVLMLKDIAQGEGDLTKRLEILKKDEIGELAGWFNTFLDKLQCMMRKIAEDTRIIDQSAEEFSDIATRLSEGAGDTSSRANNVSAAAEEMSTTLSSVAAAMEESSTNINFVANATKEMNGTVVGIAQNAENARSIVEQAVHKASTASNQMDNLNHAASGIGKVVETITEISEQVNLLALNATIEAARTGDAGKGFAVVANEIKELAKQTSSATLEIKEKIENIQGSTDGTVKAIGEISEVINRVDEIVVTIATAVEEQSLSTRDIASNVSQAAQGIQEVNQNVNQTSSVASEISSDIAVVNDSSSGIADNSDQVRNSAENLRQMAGELKTIVCGFKVSDDCP